MNPTNVMASKYYKQLNNEQKLVLWTHILTLPEIKNSHNSKSQISVIINRLSQNIPKKEANMEKKINEIFSAIGVPRINNILVLDKINELRQECVKQMIQNIKVNQNFITHIFVNVTTEPNGEISDIYHRITYQRDADNALLLNGRAIVPFGKKFHAMSFPIADIALLDNNLPSSYTPTLRYCTLF